MAIMKLKTTSRLLMQQFSPELLSILLMNMVKKNPLPMTQTTLFFADAASESNKVCVEEAELEDATPEPTQVILELED